MKNREKVVIGRNAKIDFLNFQNAKKIPAKIDTGADSSAVFASEISIDENGFLNFVLFDKNSEFYTGEIFKTREFEVAKVRNSFGDIQIRYRAKLSVKIKNRKIKSWFNLSNRAQNRFPVLIGRRLLNAKFLVDVSKYVFPKNSREDSTNLSAELWKNPQKFHENYFENPKNSRENLQNFENSKGEN